MTCINPLVFKSNSLALSQHRTERLRRTIQTKAPEFQGNVSSYWIYLIQLSEDSTVLSKFQMDMILQLLQAHELPSSFQINSSLSFFVYPRLGTISSWSSKATDIFHVCGLSTVFRVERGLMYQFSHPFDNSVQSLLYDPMLETIFTVANFPDISTLLLFGDPRPLITIEIRSKSDSELQHLGQELGLGLNMTELQYIKMFYNDLGRDPTDVELMMYAQVNSEHCRHKIFNATWEINNKRMENTLFSMIKNTYHQNKAHVLSAYSDNAAVLEGPAIFPFSNDPGTHEYVLNKAHNEAAHMVIKVETHNHPTAVSPHPGASTGTGGEIRDEGSVGQGSQSKAGLTGFTVDSLRIPDLMQPWETSKTDSKTGVSSLDIMLQAPLGSASFGNEFGRPNLVGYFRTFSFQQNDSSHSQDATQWGYRKPIMLAGGMGQIRPMHIQKQKIMPGNLLIVLGGPCMLIGLGGGAASSVSGGASSIQLEFASVQRANPEMQRRCQMVIDQCTQMGALNPIIAIHDVGAGGLSNALPELVHDAQLGAKIQLRQILCDDASLSPMEIWCNESQERYVLGLHRDQLSMFQKLCERERCPFATVGEATSEKKLVVYDSLFEKNVVDIEMEFLFARSPLMHRKDNSVSRPAYPLYFEFEGNLLKEAASRVLQFPAVASKSFLIHIADRFVGGLTTREQCIGKWQVPVSDVAVISTTFETWTGQAMALGEKPPLALLSPVASVRMAVGEALLNLLAANIESLGHVRLSANWMAAVNQAGEGDAIYAAVEALGLFLCPDLQIAIPVGKDSLSMKSHHTVSPLSLNVTAYAVVKDTRLTFTPCLQSKPDTILVLVDLSGGANRLGGSTLAQVFNQIGQEPPNFDDPCLMLALWKFLQSPVARKHVLAYHDRSDGGLFTTICEMCFCSRLGFKWELPLSPGIQDLALLSYFYNEELGVVLQICRSEFNEFCDFATSYGLSADLIHILGSVQLTSYQLDLSYQNQVETSFDLFELQKIWSLTSYHIKKLRDNAVTADSELQSSLDPKNEGLFSKITFEYPTLERPFTSRPKVAILREQGVNSHMEMAYSFHAAGFTCFDVHMTDLLEKKIDLSEFVGLAACGGFSFGDVLGAGRGWAMSILGHSNLRESFKAFFYRSNTFALGICNGCQMFSYLRDLFPDPQSASNLPYFVKNVSDQFEARTVMVEIVDSKSIFFQSMAGTCLPIPVAHGEGLASYPHPEALLQLKERSMLALRFVDKPNGATEVYPQNPNGSKNGWTGFTSNDGRITLVMPHPERVTRWFGQSWVSNEWAHDGYDGPWLKMFQNARKFIG